MSDTISQKQRAIDVMAVSNVSARLARQPHAPWLHAEVARRMAERLGVIKIQPGRLIEWWPGLGGAGDLLAQAYPAARRLWVEPTPEWLACSRRQGRRPWRDLVRPWRRSAPQLMLERDMPRASAGAQLVWANMMLHAVDDPPALMLRWRELLEVDGFVMFSCFGPDTLCELRALHACRGWGPSHAAFVDMHDLGDMLVHAGFADPVMDQERLTMTWPDPAALLAELRQLGGNADPARHPGLRTPRWRQRLEADLAALADARGRLPLSFEIVYGHAFKAPPRAPLRQETAVSLGDMRDMVRRARATDKP